ncbi:hypothetical protein [Fibrella aquatilis]|uniref:Uncharacterized protein n=1 Tax=Fibrella aquatilis TaxID=2817059 RepID=A0A939K1A8_9BACT|nr:hypothetical protein [Fibrella aquatilis]MBO0933323.1 hypothetical protein [Fibrella aquatilis]
MLLDTLEKVRAEVLRYAEVANQAVEPPTVVLSPCGVYRLTLEWYYQADTDRNWVITKATICLAATETPILAFFADHDDAVYAWLYRNNKPYLLLPECQGGQSIIDLELGELISYYNHDDPFIWLTIYPSPDGKKIAVDGCYWACPFELVIYDCTALTTLPYPILHRQMLAPLWPVYRWNDEQTLLMVDEKGDEQVVWKE